MTLKIDHHHILGINVYGMQQGSEATSLIEASKSEFPDQNFRPPLVESPVDEKSIDASISKAVNMRIEGTPPASRDLILVLGHPNLLGALSNSAKSFVKNPSKFGLPYKRKNIFERAFMNHTSHLTINDPKLFEQIVQEDLRRLGLPGDIISEGCNGFLKAMMSCSIGEALISSGTVCMLLDGGDPYAFMVSRRLHDGIEIYFSQGQTMKILFDNGSLFDELFIAVNDFPELIKLEPTPKDDFPTGLLESYINKDYLERKIKVQSIILGIEKLLKTCKKIHPTSIIKSQFEFIALSSN